MPHERTLPKAKSDRLELLRATRANLDPIWGLSLAAGPRRRSSATRPTASRTRPPTDEDGVRHALWRDHRSRRASRAIARRRGLRAARAGRRPPPLRDRVHYRPSARRGTDDPGADAIMTLVVELAADQLCVRAIHRLLIGVARPSTSAPRSPARSRCTTPGPNDARRRRRARDARCATAAGSGWSTATASRCSLPTAELDDPHRPSSRPSCATSTRPRVRRRGAPAVPGVTLAYRNDAAPSPRQVEKGDADAAVLLRPVSVDTIRAAAAAGRAHAGEDDVLRAQAAHRHGVPQPRRLS